MNGVSYFRKWGFSINEGGTPINIHIQWFRPWTWFFIYLYIFGKRFHWTWKRSSKSVTELMKENNIDYATAYAEININNKLK